MQLDEFKKLDEFKMQLQALIHSAVGATPRLFCPETTPKWLGVVMDVVERALVDEVGQDIRGVAC